METLRSDLRLAIRMLLKKPGFTAATVITLALGIAVNATMFSMVSAFLFRRPFAVGDAQQGSARVDILSSALSQRRFGSDASLIGRTIRLNRDNYTVIGVMPPNFRLLGFTPHLWPPLVLTAADQTAAAHHERSLFLFARLKSGVTLEQARAEFTTLAHRAEENFPESEKVWVLAVRTLPDFLVYTFGIRSALAIIMTTAGFV